MLQDQTFMASIVKSFNGSWPQYHECELVSNSTIKYYCIDTCSKQSLFTNRAKVVLSNNVLLVTGEVLCHQIPIRKLNPNYGLFIGDLLSRIKERIETADYFEGVRDVRVMQVHRNHEVYFQIQCTAVIDKNFDVGDFDKLIAKLLTAETYFANPYETDFPIITE